MKKVIINNSGSVEDVIEMLNKECLMLKEDSGFIKDEIIKGGSGIYELSFGGWGDFELEKNDEYYSKEELMDEDNKEFLDEYYNDEDNSEVGEDYDFVKCVGYFEESWSLFVKVEV
jgi:hypothetical protein